MFHLFLLGQYIDINSLDFKIEIEITHDLSVMHNLALSY